MEDTAFAGWGERLDYTIDTAKVIDQVVVYIGVGIIPSIYDVKERQI